MLFHTFQKDLLIYFKSSKAKKAIPSFLKYRYPHFPACSLEEKLFTNSRGQHFSISTGKDFSACLTVVFKNVKHTTAYSKLFIFPESSFYNNAFHILFYPNIRIKANVKNRVKIWFSQKDFHFIHYIHDLLTNVSPNTVYK